MKTWSHGLIYCVGSIKHEIVQLPTVLDQNITIHILYHICRYSEVYKSQAICVGGSSMLPMLQGFEGFTAGQKAAPPPFNAAWMQGCNHLGPLIPRRSLQVVEIPSSNPSNNSGGEPPRLRLTTPGFSPPHVFTTLVGKKSVPLGLWLRGNRCSKLDSSETTIHRGLPAWYFSETRWVGGEEFWGSCSLEFYFTTESFPN